MTIMLSPVELLIVALLVSSWNGGIFRVRGQPTDLECGDWRSSCCLSSRAEKLLERLTETLQTQHNELRQEIKELRTLQSAILAEQSNITRNTSAVVRSVGDAVLQSTVSAVMQNAATCSVAWNQTRKSCSQCAAPDPTTTGCGQTLTAATGHLVSPGWPGKYADYASCNVSIIAPNGTAITLFFNFFELEYESTCRYDSLTITGTIGGKTNSVKLCNRTGNIHPVTFNTNTIQLTFVTDHSAVYGGYDITYIAASTTDCGGTLTAASGTFTSPMYPGRYSAGISCLWRICVPLGERIKLRLSILSTSGGSASASAAGCPGSYVAVDDNMTAVREIWNRHCWPDTDMLLTSSCNNLLVVYQSTSNTANNVVFKIAYWSI